MSGMGNGPNPHPNSQPTNMVRISGSFLTALGSFGSNGRLPGRRRPTELIYDFDKVTSCLVTSATAGRFQDWIIDIGAQVIQGRDILGFSQHRTRSQRADKMRLRVHIQGIVHTALES